MQGLTCLHSNFSKEECREKSISELTYLFSLSKEDSIKNVGPVFSFVY